MAEVAEQTARPSTGLVITPVGGVRQSSATDLSGGTDGNWVTLQFDASGNLRVTSAGGSSTIQGMGTTGAAVGTQPVLVGGKDGSGNLQPIATNTSGMTEVVGGFTAGTAASNSRPILIGGSDLSGNIQNVPLDLYNAQVVCNGGQPFKSVNAVATTGNGSTLNVGFARTNWSVQVITTGSPTGLDVSLQASHDNSNFFTVSLAAHGAATVSAGHATSAGMFNSLTPFPAQYARLSVNTLSGGTSPTVTGWLCGC